jgi:two-component system, sensor histidine kinase and response regulator
MSIDAVGPGDAVSERSNAEAEGLLRFGELVAGILAHDLRNPLAAMLMNARLLRSSEREREQTIGKRIESSGERMSRMIDQILEWSRVRANSGHFQLKSAACDLGAIAEEVVREHQSRQPEAAVVVEARGKLQGHWDADRLAQLLCNLIDNGVDHATRPGVTVQLDGDGADVKLTVENVGAIPDDAMPNLFEPFRGRANGARSKGRGLGLGLYISRQIVAAHGGHIDVARDEGRIAFTVTLPRQS